MNDRPTPETDAFREMVIQQYKEDECTGNGLGNILLALTDIARLERERDEWKAKYIQQNKDLRCEMMDPNGTIWDHAKKLQDENKALQEQLDFERELNKHKAVADAIGIGEAVGESVKDRIDALQEQLDAAIMLGKMQERRHARELEQVREQYRLSSAAGKLLQP